MKLTSSNSLLTLGLLAASLLPVAAAEPCPYHLLREMSVKLASAKAFSFEATREIDAALLEAAGIPEKAQIAVSVQRPNKLTAHAKSKAGARQFVFNGRTLSLLDVKSNHYATVPAPATIDDLVELLDAKYGFTPPLAEFALSDPYADFTRLAHTVTYLGRGKTSEGFLGLGGVECHRLGLKGRGASAELWIGVSDHLPRKMVATFGLQKTGKLPQVKIAFSSWNLAAPVTAADFTFTPPRGAQKIEMWSTAKMQKARKH